MKRKRIEGIAWVLLVGFAIAAESMPKEIDTLSWAVLFQLLYKFVIGSGVAVRLWLLTPPKAEP